MDGAHCADILVVWTQNQQQKQIFARYLISESPEDLPLKHPSGCQGSDRKKYLPFRLQGKRIIHPVCVDLHSVAAPSQAAYIW